MDGLDAERDDTDFGLEYPTENFGPEHLPAGDSLASPSRSGDHAIPMWTVLHNVVDSAWTHLQLRIELNLSLVLGTPLQEHATAHVHECTRHLSHSVHLVEQLFQESALEMALREQNRWQNPNYWGKHPRGQVIPAI